VKSDVENLSETRIKLNVEIAFDELQDEVAAAYRKISEQATIPGFRKGKVPRQIIDQRIGRGPILEEVVNSRVPAAYDEIIAEQGVYPMGQPDVEVTEIADGDKIAFTAEVDIRPEFELPDYRGLDLEVDALDVTEEDVEEQLTALQTQFGTYKTAERAAADGDVLLVDIDAKFDGEDVDDLSQTALSYEVGKDGVVPGLDDAVIGLNDGEEKTFVFTPEVGDLAEKSVDITVRVKAVRERELPEVDDEFAMLASEFDTAEELIADVRERLGRSRLMERGQLARTKAHDSLLELIDIPVPEGAIQGELQGHFEDGHGDPDHRAEVEDNARKNLKAQFIFDKIADAEDISVEEAELSQWLMMQAQQYGMSPDEFAQALVKAGQVPTAYAEVRRGKALALVLEEANIVDTNGDEVDLKEIDRILNERANAMAQVQAAMSAAEAEAETEVVEEAEEIVEEAEVAEDMAAEAQELPEEVAAETAIVGEVDEIIKATDEDTK
jgi:trigger factor